MVHFKAVDLYVLVHLVITWELFVSQGRGKKKLYVYIYIYIYKLYNYSPNFRHTPKITCLWNTHAHGTDMISSTSLTGSQQRPDPTSYR